MDNSNLILADKTIHIHEDLVRLNTAGQPGAERREVETFQGGSGGNTASFVINYTTNLNPSYPICVYTPLSLYYQGI